MIRPAQEADRAAMEAFLATRVATSMFLASNLRDHGLTGTGHPKATTFWLAEKDGKVHGIFGHSEMGYVLADTPRFDPAWSAPLRADMAGRKVRGLKGDAEVIGHLASALGLHNKTPGFQDVDPHYQLRLADLIVPPGDTRLRAMAPEDMDLIAGWRHAFDCEVFGDDQPDGRDRSIARARDMIRTGRGRLLESEGQPVAMTAFNAVLPEAVQIGSVYTPKESRGAGHARRAVALHLAEAAQDGVTTAILFSSGPAANRAYEAIGFRRIGEYRLIDFAPPVQIEAPS